MGWTHREYVIASNMIPGIGGRRLLALKEHFGSLKEAWQSSEQELRRVPGLGPKTAAAFCQARPKIDPIAEETWTRRLGAQIITWHDGDYPTSLHALAVPPPVLYVRGQLPTESGIAVVGTRRPSRVGIAQTKDFTAQLVRAGKTIISGLARGVDYHAHVTAVEMGGRTVAVLGSNLANLYPAEHRQLVEMISERGAVISEFSSNCPTLPGNFPRRNRLIAALANGVLVVQAGSRSGAITTCDWALELGLDIWSIPGEIRDPLRSGNHKLIKEGAFLVTDASDILGGQPSSTGGREPSLAELYRAGHHVNEIAATLDLPIHDVLIAISLLQVEKKG